MRRFSLFAPIALISALALPALAQTVVQQSLPAAQALPAAKTLAYVEVMDWYQAETALKTTDLGQAWSLLQPFRDKIMKGLNAQLASKKDEFAKQFGVTADDLQTLLQSGFAVAAVDTAPAGGQPQIMPVFVFPRQAKMMINTLVETIKKQNGQGGPPLFVVEREGVVCVAMDQNAVLPADGTGGPALSADATFQSLRTRATGGQPPIMHMYVNVAGALQRFVGGDKKISEALDSLGLASVKGVAMGLACDGGRIREAMVLSSPGERKGLLALLTNLAPVDPAKLAEATPDGNISFSAARLNFRAIYDSLLGICKGLNPEDVAQIDKAIADVEQDLGMKIREDILDALGDVQTSEMWVPEDGFMPASVFSITIKDAPKVQRAIGELTRRAGFQIATLERGGKRISYLVQPLGEFGQNPMEGDPMERGVQAFVQALFGAWTIDQGKIYISATPQGLSERFDRMQGGTSLAENEDFKKAVAKMPSGARSFSYSKTRGIMGVVYDLVHAVMSGIMPYARKAGIDVDTALLPTANQFAKGFRPATSALVVDAEGVAIISQGGLPVLTTIPVIAAIAVPAALTARKKAEASQVQNDLRMVAMAESIWKEDKNAYTANLQDLIQAGQIDPELQDRMMRQGYMLKIELTESGFRVMAQPMGPGKMGLEVDESMSVHPMGMRPRTPPPPPPPPHAPDGNDGMAPPDGK